MKIGVIIGRFQTYELHQGYKYLLDYIEKEYGSNYIVVLGTSHTINLRNLLGFKIRKLIILNYVLTNLIELTKIMDVGNVDLWSKNLNEPVDSVILSYIEKINISISSNCSNNVQIDLIGSRDSFAKNYNGKN